MIRDFLDLFEVCPPFAAAVAILVVVMIATIVLTVVVAVWPGGVP